MAALGTVLFLGSPLLVYGPDGRPLFFLLFLLVFLPGLVLALLWQHARRRAEEYAADRWAAEHGAPLTSEHVAWARATFRGQNMPRSLRLLSTRPSWEDRLAAVARRGY